MASIAKRPDGSWRARYRGPDGKERSKHFGRKLDAQRWLDSVASQVVTGSWTDPERSRITLATWSDQWLAGQLQLKESTRVRYGTLLRVHVLPTWGTVKLTDVSHTEVSAWVQRIAAGGSSASTVRQAHRVLSLILDVAVRDGRLPKNPASGVRLPRAHVPERVFLTHDQVDALAQAACQVGGTGDGLVVRTLAYTGLRWGELAALRVGRLDLMRRRLEVAEAVTEVGGRAVWGTPKTHATRVIAVPRSLVDDLAAQVAGRAPTDLAFTAPRGGVLLLRNWRRNVFVPAIRDAGLEGLTVHGLRHTAASLAASAGASVRHVQAMLGHASPVLTLSTYQHLFDDDLDAVADRLDAAADRARQDRADQVRTSASVTQLG
ncbi:integrase [Kineococcus radiotolerans]|uniref:Integrase n=1 Tax=Kineococcus radiotolerans TaxID=131568 RepID=A0A7W4XWI8_KINRA|nr:tyrosine-type recombinase/integrase [Kineococcus radiotolerans]MBB2900497.1 integrase [Kineococcus radiotolerans]